MSKKTVNVLSTAVSLLTGCAIYVVFSPKTYISKLIRKYISIKETVIPSEWVFVRYYLTDYLWALAFACCLNILLGFDRKQVIFSAAVSVVFGVIWELLQKLNIVGGTGDILDVFMYLLAGITAIIINIKEKKQ